jgi:DNA (cytosine-5)-methyltransferase 1
MPKSKPLRSVEIFAGAGGLALGTAQAGFSHVAVIERHGPACDTLRKNKSRKIKHAREWNILENDVTEHDFTQYKNIDLVSGGPPCQPFSQGGKRHGRNDDRDMFPEFIRAIREIAPKAFVIENVKGLLNAPMFNYFNYLLYQLRFPYMERRHSEKWKEHRARLEKLYTGNRYKGVQYQVVSQVLNATDYGVAQNRNRVFIVGIRSDLEIEYSFPLATHTRNALLRDQWVTGEYWKRHDFSKKERPKMPEGFAYLLPKLKKLDDRELPWATVRDALSGLPSIAIGNTSKKVLNHFLNDGACAYYGHSGCSLDWPAKTLKAGYHGVPGGENIVQLDNGDVRYFSVRECARLQTFPDKWGFEGSWTGCMRQVGNAVPVTLSEIVAAPLAAAFGKQN